MLLSYATIRVDFCQASGIKMSVYFNENKNPLSNLWGFLFYQVLVRLFFLCEKEIEDHAYYRQQEHQNDPQHLFAHLHGTLRRVNDSNDI